LYNSDLWNAGTALVYPAKCFLNVEFRNGNEITWTTLSYRASRLNREKRR
jgi:hypothetical protein